jgi:MinD-like ATPase involved in chromosome partitioning or flagellar assembly
MIYGVLPNKFDLSYFKNLSIERYNKQLLYLYKKKKYDIVLIIGGKTINENTLEKITIPKI